MTRSRRRSAPSLLLIALFTFVLAGCGTVAKPQGWAAPVVRDDTVYASDDAGKLAAYRLSGGGRLWEFPSKEAKLDLDALYGTPVLRDGTLYFGGYGGNVVAINATDGAERWRLKAGDRVISGVLLLDETVYAGTDAGELVAIGRTDGRERWRRKVANQLWATPVSDGATIYAAGMDGYVTALAPDGTTRWRTRVADAAIAGTPALLDNVLYLGSYDRHLYAVDAASGEVRWRSGSAGNWFWTEPVLDGDNLFAGNMDGSVYAVNRRDGGSLWRTDLGAPVRARTALVDGVLVAVTKEGSVWGLRPGSGEQAWQPVPLGQRLYSDVTLVQDDLYLASEIGKKSVTLYRVDAAQGSVTQVALAN